MITLLWLFHLNRRTRVLLEGKMKIPFLLIQTANLSSTDHFASFKMRAFSRVWVCVLGLALTVPATLCEAQDTLQEPSGKSRILEPEKIVEIPTADFVRVKHRVDYFVDKHSADEVLVVIDIDNTLLAMNQDLGSDQWFGWQDDLRKNDPDSPDLIDKEFAGLLRAQGMLFALSEMHPPEPGLPSLVQQIQDSGVTTIVLTSRGPDFRNAAERELKRNRYSFEKSALSIREKRGRFFPFDPQKPLAHGLSADTIEKIQSRLGEVSYSNGIYMTAGQHKGYMLKTLLARATDDGKKRRFKAIVFVDDHQKHVDRMQEAFRDDDLDVSTFRYTREDGNVANFTASKKGHVIEDWKRLQGFMSRALVK